MPIEKRHVELRESRILCQQSGQAFSCFVCVLNNNVAMVCEIFDFIHVFDSVFSMTTAWGLSAGS